MGNMPKLNPIKVQRPPIDLSQTVFMKCESCQYEFFDLAWRLGKISKFADGNKTGQEINIESKVFICRGCGLRVGQKVETTGH